MINKDITFIIPAAGKSSRFESNKSKIFYEFNKKPLILHIVDKCLKFSNNIIIIINKKNIKPLKVILSKYKKKITFVYQNQAKGMGHAISLGLRKSKTLCTSVIWSDQIFLSIKTISKTIVYFKKNNSLLCFPVFKKKTPYVYILRDINNCFRNIIQTREGGKPVGIGESDCGFFIFKTRIIKNLLQDLIRQKKILTKKTKEIDFLKAFKFFKKNGRIDTVKALSIKDTIGINTIGDFI